MQSQSVLSIIEQWSQPNFEPVGGIGFVATGATPGSQEKIDVMADRAARGFPLFHENDRSDYAGVKTVKFPGVHSVQRTRG